MSETSSSPPRPLVGDVIAGKYRIDGVAGEGGMGIVYEAEHVILSQRVAIKVVLPGIFKSSEAAERFLLEARAAARIACEHVVRVMDAGSLANDTPYLVMEYLEGCDLKVLLERRGGVLPAKEVVDYTLQALEALAHAHTAGVIHRDVKPENLFLATCADGRQIIKMLDFGISKSLEKFPNAKSKLTGPRVLGSPVYMSPEQLRNGNVDPRSDLWSLGVVMYELLCGTTPFPNTANIVELIAAILERDAPPLFPNRPAISQALADIVAKCLRRDPWKRWTNTGELAAALGPHGTGLWTGAIDRIDRLLSRPAKSGVKSPSGQYRRFDSYELALHALEETEAVIETATTPSEPTSEGGGGVVAKKDPSLRSTLPPHSDSGSGSGSGDDGGPPKNTASERTKTEVDEELMVGVTRMPEGPESASLGASNPQLRILLIEDSELTMTVHDSLLRAAGFDVRTTTPHNNPEAVMDWPHLIIIDVRVADVVATLCRRIRARAPSSVPIVLISDAPEMLHGERSGSVMGIDAFLSKKDVLNDKKEGRAFVDFVRNICAITYSPEALPEDLLS